MTFEEDFPSFKKIERFVKPIDQQLFSCRNGYTNVVPEDAVKKLVTLHCVDKKKVKEAIDKWKRTVKEKEDHLENHYSYEDAILDSYKVMKMFQEVEKELGLGE